MKKIFTLLTIAVAISITSFAQIASWDFTGAPAGGAATMNATASDPNLAGTVILSRGAGAASSGAGANSFRTIGFKNDGISLLNTDYYQFSLSPALGFKLSLSNIQTVLAGTASFAASVSNQFAYSLDGTTFVLIGSPSVTTITPAPYTVDLSAIAALQNIPFGTTVIFRYYASGQTATGGWGFNSPSAGTNGLAIGGSLTPSVVAVSINQLNASKAATKSNLSWTLGCSATECTYELQRSANGIQFTTIQTETVSQDRCRLPFSYTDASPLKAVNYYRIKLTDVDGKVSYSNVAALRFNGIETIKVVPTIAVNDVKVFYEAAAAGASSWMVYDMSGRVVSRSNVNLVRGQNTITLNVSNFMKGQYQVVGNTEAGKTESVKIIKQ